MYVWLSNFEEEKSKNIIDNIFSRAGQYLGFVQ